jgi:hypothetical protein
MVGAPLPLGSGGAVARIIYSNEGRQRKKEMKATYICQMANGVGKYLLFF